MAQADYRRLNRELAERIARYAAAIRSTFYRLSNELVRLALKVAGGVDAEAPFRFDAYPELSKEAERVFTRLRQEVYDTIINAQEAERTMADIDAGTIAVATLGEKAAKSNPKYNPLFVAAPVMTLQALREFTRTVGPPQSATPSSGASPPSLPPKAPGGTSLPGNIVPRRFDLSGRVWNLTGNFRNEIQQLIDGGIRDGLSADSLSRRVQKYLNEPDRLFRRVRDADGKLTLSKAAEGYHPGRGVYRSSYKNAMRLARTEINMAYHEQAHERWRQLDFIAGFRVVLSNAHPVYDICDELQGEYPKDFKFTGWHPQCMCHTIALIKGEDREAKDVPENFKKWMRENEERIAAANGRGTLPYFLQDNSRYVQLGQFKMTERQKFASDSHREYLQHDTQKWKRDYFNRDNGGYLVVDRERIAHSKTSKNEKAKFDKEYAMSMVFAKGGYKIEMLKEVSGISSYDVLINGVAADLKRLSGHNNIVSYAKKATRKQGAKIVLFEFDTMTGKIRDELNRLKRMGIKVKYFTADNKTTIIDL